MMRWFWRVLLLAAARRSAVGARTLLQDDEMRRYFEEHPEELWVGSEELKRHFERNVWRWNAGRGRAWDRQFESDAAMRAEWSERAGRPYPGSEHGGVDLRCRERGGVAGGQARRKYVEEVLRALVKERELPLARSLEIGPCTNPLELPGALVRHADTLDSESGAAYCAARWVALRGGEARDHLPTYVDDGQYLAKVPSGYYDVVYASRAGAAVLQRHFNMTVPKRKR